MGSVLAILLTLTLALLPSSRADERIAAGLPFTPYAGSYLPVNQGALVHPSDPRSGTSGSVARLLDRGLLDGRGTSTLQRFDRARASSLGTGERLSPALEARFLQPEAPDWAGLCHQWAAASIDPMIASLLESTEGILCDGTFLSRGDIKELMTAFYQRTRKHGLHGRKTTREPSPVAARARDATGVDDLLAHDFHRDLYARLRSGRGIVIDVDAAVPVWNQPVFAAQSTLHELATSKELAAAAMRVPVSAFDGADTDAARALSELSRLDRAIRAGATGRALPSDELRAAAKPFRPPLLRHLWPAPDLEQLVRMREEYSATTLAALLARGRVRLKPGVRVRRATTQVSYSKEVRYAAPDDRHVAERVYRYLLVEKDGEPVASAWETPSARRPDFVAMPEAKVAERGVAAQDGPLGELLALLAQCTDAREAVEFFDALEAAVGDGHVASQERQDLLARHARVRGLIRYETLLDAFGPDPVIGLKPSDFK